MILRLSLDILRTKANVSGLIKSPRSAEGAIAECIYSQRPVCWLR